MMKKTVLALFGLVITLALVAPPKANAQVTFGIGIGRPAYGYAVPRAYVYAPAPYVAYEPGYVYPYAYAPYPEVVLGGGWYGGGYGYGRGYGWRGGGYGGRGYGYEGRRGFAGRGGSGGHGRYGGHGGHGGGGRR